MTRKHFKEIAKTIAQIEDATERKRQAEAMATICKQTNPRFDNARFLTACGVEG